MDEAPAPYRLIPGTAEVVILCDHASAAIPPELDGLGLAPTARTAHIAWDPGAAPVALALARRLDAWAVLSGISRLVIDPNRPPGGPGSIPAESDGVAVPGNQALPPEQIVTRISRWFDPYHQAIAHTIRAAGPAPTVVAIHSFTPRLASCPTPRPWHVGILWNQDDRLAAPLLAELRSCPDLVVGDNQPYSGRTTNYTLDCQAAAFGLPHVSIEIRQDLLTAPDAADLWADRLAACLRPSLQRQAAE